MSQSPSEQADFKYESSYADAARQLNKLVRAGRSYSGHERNRCFLNVEGKRFANASFVSGFDFAEDGRAVAVCDWDGDGDQDFWVANRTAPQLRFMRNDLGYNSGIESNFIQFRLEGTESNRDAIGARIRIVVNLKGSETTLQRTVRAGEGFLACHSKRIHFGVAAVKRIDSVEVSWPSGRLEQFGAIDHVNTIWILKEASGKLQRVRKPESEMPVGNLASSGQAIDKPSQSQTPKKLTNQPAKHSLATHNLLTEPLPTPPLIYEAFTGTRLDAAVGSSKPVLINLWATWCQPCMVELGEWSRQAGPLEEHVTILALSVDRLEAKATGSSPAKSSLRTMLGKIGVPGEHGLATPELLDVLQLLHNTVYDHHRPLPVPSSFLLDQDGRLRAVYKGPVDAARIIADAKLIRDNGVQNSDSAIGNNAFDSRALPFPGIWLGKQGTHNVSLLVEELFREGYEDEASAYVERFTGPRLLGEQVQARLHLAEQLATSKPEAAARHATEVLKIDAQNATAHERLALIYARANRFREASLHFQQAISLAKPLLARTPFNYGKLLRKANAIEQAIEQFTEVLRIDPRFAQAHEQLGLIAASQQDLRRAAAHFEQATNLRPNETPFRVNLAMAYSRLGEHEAAWLAIEPVTLREDAPSMSLLFGAQTLELLDKLPAAIELLELYLRREPNADDARKQLERMRSKSQN